MDTQQSGGAAAFIDALRTMKQCSEVKKITFYVVRAVRWHFILLCYNKERYTKNVH